MSQQHSDSVTWSKSDAYEAFIGRWSRMAANAALDWLDLPSGLRWLDVGCGTGASTETIVKRAEPIELLAIDPSADFLGRARQLVPDDRATFEQGTAEELPVSDGRFDVAIACLALHFMSDPQLGLNEMTRAVRSGGTVTGYIWDISSDDQFTSPFWSAATALDRSAAAWEPLHRQKLNSAQRLLGIFQRAPLGTVTSAALQFPAMYCNFDDYWLPCLLDGSSPVQRYIRTLSEDRKTTLREQLRRKLPIAADGSIPLQGRLWIVRGTRKG